MPQPVYNPNIVVIGGGGGTAAIYPEIANRTDNATAILGMFDSGGSTGRLSDQLNILPVGDLRNAMMAAGRNQLLRSLRNHRFGGNGELKGHSIGNLILAAFVETNDFDLDESVRQMCQLLDVPGTILPVTTKQAELVLQDGDKTIHGEHHIDVYHTTSAEPRVYLEPQVPANPKALEAIRNADIVVIAAGSIYTSLEAALSPDGVREAIAETKAPVVMLANLATEQHQTDGWHVADYVLAMQRHGINPDYVLYNTQQPSEEMLENYAQEGERPVDISPEGFRRAPMARYIGAALLSRSVFSSNPNDPVKRGLMRHDAGAVCDELWRIMLSHQHFSSVLQQYSVAR